MSKLRLLVGTRKGAWIISSDGAGFEHAGRAERSRADRRRSQRWLSV